MKLITAAVFSDYGGSVRTSPIQRLHIDLTDSTRLASTTPSTLSTGSTYVPFYYSNLSELTFLLRPPGAFLSQFLGRSRGRLVSGYFPLLDSASVEDRVWRVSISSSFATYGEDC